jgi:hypothetical protein
LTEKYNISRGVEIEKKIETNNKEVVDGYTEYFSQGCDYNG